MNRIYRPLLLLTAILLVISQAIAHDVPVHRRITTKAIDASQGFADFMAATCGSATASPKFTFDSVTLAPRDWIIRGSAVEDDGLRPKNHFYDPIRNSGLTDTSETGAVLMFTAPIPSFTWASQRNGGGAVLQNKESWQNARDYLFAGLTTASKSERESNFAHAFLALGQVTHLLEDLSQPSHTRNDNHFRVRYIEKYGLRNIDNLDYDAAALDWASAGFSKLNDFWDRGLFTGANADALNNDSGENTLGLAEFSNGNFLSEDALYGELFDHQALGYFPQSVLYFKYPSRTTGTNYDSLMLGVPTGTMTTTLRDGTSVNRIIVHKIADGINVEHHAALSFFGFKMAYVPHLPNKLEIGVSINDESVLKEYHSILIPKAVSYAAGLMDYFFRGKVDVRLTWDQATSRYKLQITNASTQKFKRLRYFVWVKKVRCARPIRRLTGLPGPRIGDSCLRPPRTDYGGFRLSAGGHPVSFKGP